MGSLGGCLEIDCEWKLMVVAMSDEAALWMVMM